MPVIEIEFKKPNPEIGYNVFPKEYEDEPNVLFHGSSEECISRIIDEGFQRKGELGSTSFARTSSLSLVYACNKRTNVGRGAILAVRFKDLDSPALRKEFAVIYLDNHSIEYQPELIAICYIPNDYKHI